MYLNGLKGFAVTCCLPCAVGAQVGSVHHVIFLDEVIGVDLLFIMDRRTSLPYFEFTEGNINKSCVKECYKLWSAFALQTPMYKEMGEVGLYARTFGHAPNFKCTFHWEGCKDIPSHDALMLRYHGIGNEG